MPDRDCILLRTWVATNRDIWILVRIVWIMFSSIKLDDLRQPVRSIGVQGTLTSGKARVPRDNGLPNDVIVSSSS